MERILSIDHGTCSGYALLKYDGKEVEKEKSGFVKFDSATTYDEIYDRFKELILRLKPDTIVLEKVNIAGVKFNANAILRLCEIRSMVKLVADQEGIEMREVNPTSMKKFITGNGRQTKHFVAKEICDIFGLVFADIPHIRTKSPRYDEMDAIAMAYYDACRQRSAKLKNSVGEPALLSRICVKRSA